MNNVVNVSLSASEATKRSDLKDEQFLYPKDRAFPITGPDSIPKALHDWGRSKREKTYEAFVHKLYNWVKKRHPEWLSAFPDATLEKVGIKKKTAKAKLALGVIQEAIADMGDMSGMDDSEDVTQEDLNNVCQMMYSNIDSLYSMINNLYNTIYQGQGEMYNMMSEHLKGHAPAFKGASQMEKYVKMFMPGDITVQPQVIYASDGKASKLILEIPIK